MANTPQRNPQERNQLVEVFGDKLRAFTLEEGAPFEVDENSGGMSEAKMDLNAQLNPSMKRAPGGL